MGLLAEYLLHWFSIQPLSLVVKGITDAVNVAPWYSTWAFILATGNLCFPDILLSIKSEGFHCIFRVIKLYSIYTLYTAIWSICLAYVDIYLPHYFVKPFAIRQLLANFTLIISIIIMIYSFHHTGLIFGIRNKDLPYGFSEFMAGPIVYEIPVEEFIDGDDTQIGIKKGQTKRKIKKK